MNENVITKQDIMNIIATIKVNYCDAYQGYGESEMRALRDCWFESLKDYPRDLVMLAVKKVIETCEFTPKLANIMTKIKDIQTAARPTDTELWAELTSVLGDAYNISRYLSYPQYYKWATEKLDKIFNGLSEELKLFVTNRSTLIEFSEMSQEALQYERARFFRQIPTLRSHQSDKVDAQKLIAACDEKAKLTQGKK